MMKLKIQIKDNITTIQLLTGKKAIDQIVFSDINNLSDQLLPAIDLILKRNKLILADIKKIDSAIDIPESYTASRIAKAVMKGLELKA